MSFKNWGNKEASLEALYVLDSAFLEPGEEYLRLISKRKDENSLRYVVDNGQGDLLDVVFTREAVLVRGFDHENELNALSTADKSVVEQIYSGEAAKFRSYFLLDEIEQTTFFIWYDGVEHQNLVGGNNGGRWLLGYAFDDEMLKKLYEKGELEKERLKEIR